MTERDQGGHPVSTETPDPTPQPEGRLHQAIRDALNLTVSGLGELRETLAAELGLDTEDIRVHGYIPGQETRHGYDARLRIEVLNGTAASPVPQVREDGAYREQIRAALEAQGIPEDSDRHTWDSMADVVMAVVSPLLAERDRAQALLAEIGYGEDHSWRIEKEAQERITELTAQRDKALQELDAALVQRGRLVALTESWCLATPDAELGDEHDDERSWEFRVSDTYEVAMWMPGNEPWFIFSPLSGQFVQDEHVEGWRRFVPADGRHVARWHSASAAPVEAETPAPVDCGSCSRCLGSNHPYMIVCSECGNKRCPHATDHGNECTGSNEPGQPGSRYEHAVTPSPTLAQTRIGTDWCPSCRMEAGTNRYPADDCCGERCGACGSELGAKPEPHPTEADLAAAFDVLAMMDERAGFDRTAAHSEHVAEHVDPAPAAQPEPQEERYPSEIAITCDTCGHTDRRDYVVSDGDGRPQRFEYARTALRKEGWTCLPYGTGDFCPRHPAASSGTGTEADGE